MRDMDRSQQLETVQRHNRYMAHLLEKHDSIYAFASTVPYGGDPFLREFERAVKEDGLKGAWITSSLQEGPVRLSRKRSHRRIDQSFLSRDHPGFGRTEQRFGQRRRACRAALVLASRATIIPAANKPQDLEDGPTSDCCSPIVTPCAATGWRCSRFAGAARNSFAADPLACPRPKRCLAGQQRGF